MSARPGPIAAEDLAVDDGGPDCLFGRPVGDLDVFLVQEGRQLVTALMQMIAKRAAGPASRPHGRQAIEAFVQSTSGDDVLFRAEVSITMISQGEGVQKKLLDFPDKS